MDRISVSIPTYNRQEKLELLINSIPKNYQIFISDNGGLSTIKFKQKYQNVNIQTTNKILGVFSNWNNAIKLPRTEWVVMPSDDDLFLANTFSTFESILDANSDCDMIVFGHNIIDENNTVKSYWLPTDKLVNKLIFPNSFLQLKYGVNARMPSILFKTSLLKQIGYFDEKFELTAGDSDLIQRCSILGKVLFVPQVASCYRVWTGGLTSKTIITKQWIDEVTYWQDKVAIELKSKGVPDYKIRNYHDEVIARNMMGGLGTLRKNKQGLVPLLNYLKQFRYPIFANLRTHFSICKCLLGALIKG